MSARKGTKRRHKIRGGDRTRTGRIRQGGRFEFSRPFHSLKKASYRRLGKRFSGKTKYDYNHNLKEAWKNSRKLDPLLRRTYLNKFSPKRAEPDIPWLYQLLGVPSDPGPALLNPPHWTHVGKTPGLANTEPSGFGLVILIFFRFWLHSHVWQFLVFMPQSLFRQTVSRVAYRDPPSSLYYPSSTRTGYVDI